MTNPATGRVRALALALMTTAIAGSALAQDGLNGAKLADLMVQ